MRRKSSASGDRGSHPVEPNATDGDSARTVGAWTLVPSILIPFGSYAPRQRRLEPADASRAAGAKRMRR